MSGLRNAIGIYLLFSDEVVGTAKQLALMSFDTPKTLKKSIKKGLASESSFVASSHFFEKAIARSFISFQLNALLFRYQLNT